MVTNPDQPDTPKNNGEIDIQITLRAGVEHRFRTPHFVVLSHVWMQKPRLKYLYPLPPDPPAQPKRKVRSGKTNKRARAGVNPPPP